MASFSVPSRALPTSRRRPWARKWWYTGHWPWPGEDWVVRLGDGSFTPPIIPEVVMSSATISKPKRMTAEEFYDWANRPENDNRWFELVRGEVIELPAPRVPHGVVAGN